MGQTLRIAALLVLLCLVPVLLAGCATHMNPKHLNRQLTYLMADDTGRVSIEPGMRLTIRQHAAARGALSSLPPPTEYRWVRPQPGTYSRADFHFAGYLLVAGTRDAAFDEKAVFLRLASGLNDSDFNDSLGGRTIEPMFAGLAVRHSRQGLAASDSTAAWYQEAFCRGSKGEVGVRSDAQILETEFPDTVPVTLRVTFRGDWFFSSDPQSFSTNAVTTPWYHGDEVREERGMVEIEVPYVVHGEAGTRYAPLCWSVAQLERHLQREIVAVRRAIEFVDPSHTGARPAAGVPIWFGRRLRAGLRYRYLDRDEKPDVLVASGDRVILADRLYPPSEER